MMRTSLPLLLLVLAICLPMSVRAQSAPSCAPSSRDGILDYAIDARDGGAASAEGPDFRQSQRVRIVVRNKNPFRYKYKLTVKTQVVEEPALASFLGLAPFATLSAAVDTAPDVVGAEPPAPAADVTVADIDCRAAEADVDRLAPVGNLITDHYRSVKEAIDGVSRGLSPMVSAYKAAVPTLQSGQVECSALRAAATALQAQLQLGEETRLLASAKAKVGALAALAGSQLTAVKVVRARHDLAACRAASERLAAYEEHADLAFNSKAAFEATIKRLADGLKVVTTAKKEITDVLGKPDAFYTVYSLPTYKLPTNVTFSLSRDDLLDDKDTFVAFPDIELNFGGGPRFSLAIGLAYAELPVNGFERGQGVSLGRDGAPILDADGNEMLATVVSETEKSSSRVTPLLILHGRLLTIKNSNVGFHLSTGVTVNTADDNDVEFLVGPSFSFINNQLFLTLGLYYGAVRTLGDSFYVGQALPAEVTTIPVIEERDWEPTIAISYKFK